MIDGIETVGDFLRVFGADGETLFRWDTIGAITLCTVDGQDTLLIAVRDEPKPYQFHLGNDGEYRDQASKIMRRLILEK